jgi:hypothetical protein
MRFTKPRQGLPAGIAQQQHHRQFGQVQLEGFSISGTMSFQITLK